MDSDDDVTRTQDATISSALELIALSQDGFHLATANLTDSTITVGRQWNATADSGKPTLSCRSPASGGTSTGHDLPVHTLWRVCLSHGYLITSRRTCKRPAPAVHALAFSPQVRGRHEQHLALAYRSVTLLYDVATGRQTTALKGNGRVVLELQWSTHATQSAEIYDYWSNDDSPDILVLTVVTIDSARLVYVQHFDHEDGSATFVRSYGSGLELPTSASQVSKISSSTGYGRINGSPPALRDAKGPNVSKMRATSIATTRLRKPRTGFPPRTRTDGQASLDHHDPNARRTQSFPRDSPKSNLDVGSVAPSPATVVVVDEKMVSSLELPKAVTEADDDSPMPFLSPAIPSRRLPPVDEQLKLVSDKCKLFGEQTPPNSPTQYRSRETSFASTREPDSDSDDETFVPGTMHGSASFLPGGVNVPLPKGCGAVFADNGTLVTFFERRAAIHVAETNLALSKVATHRDRRRKVMRLFPSFGRVEDGDDDAEPSSSNVSSDEDVEADEEAQKDDEETSPDLLQKTSRPSDVLENAKFQSAIYDLSDIIGPSRHLAASYRSFQNPGTSLVAMCKHNANVAEASQHGQHIATWRFLAILVDNDASLDALDNTKLSFMTSSALQSSSIGPGYSGDIGPAGSWIVRQLFRMAEDKADVQLLALMSAVLVQACAIKASGVRAVEPNELLAGPQSVSRTSDPKTLTPFHDLQSGVSPKKKASRSASSSRQSSKPTTPYLDSGANIPPLPAPLSRQSSSKLSTSPELHRSSFSAAARQYAQSITDRFSAYGSSPPTKKNSPSSAEELAESLKSKMGSWGKSVSFAATDSTVDGARERVEKDDDGYDSDRTIEDVSMPQTPKSGVAIPVGVKMMNERAFGIAGSDTMSFEEGLLPPDLVQRAVVWRRYYAEQLHCWGMLIEAAEMEKLGEAAASTSSDTMSVSKSHVLPEQAAQGLATCSICSISMQGLRQFCAGCGHAAHMDCVRMWLRSCDEVGEEWVCPSGCGCRCQGNGAG